MKRTGLYVLIAMSIASVVVQLSCNNTSVQQQATFYYYPKSNVYFDVAKQVYLYSLNGGKSWEALSINSPNPPATLGDRVVIYSATDSIWKDNEAHRKQYAGVLYNISNDSASASLAGPASERKIAKKYKPQTSVANDNVKKEKPLRRFFNRLFGKRKKKEQNNQ